LNKTQFLDPPASTSPRGSPARAGAGGSAFTSPPSYGPSYGYGYYPAMATPGTMGGPPPVAPMNMMGIEQMMNAFMQWQLSGGMGAQQGQQPPAATSTAISPRVTVNQPQQPQASQASQAPLPPHRHFYPPPNVQIPRNTSNDEDSYHSATDGRPKRSRG
jgi:hypothetical protein